MQKKNEQSIKTLKFNNYFVDLEKLIFIFFGEFAFLLLLLDTLFLADVSLTLFPITSSFSSLECSKSIRSEFESATISSDAP